MPNSDYLMTEEELDKAEEAGNLTPVESKAPGNEQPAQPFPGERTAPYFSGSMPPQFQLDSNFSRARVTSDRIPKMGLMPFAPNSNPSTNAAIQSTSKTVVISSNVDTDVDNDTPMVNLQTGTVYTVQLGDLNKVISVNNAAGGTIYLPPVTLTTTVSINNITPTNNFWNSGNTVFSGPGLLIGTSSAILTVSGTAIQPGDLMMACVRLFGAVSPVVSDPNNGTWTLITQLVPQATRGSENICFFYVRAQQAIPVGGTLGITLTATYTGTAFNPQENTVWNMTGLSRIDQVAKTTGAGPGSGAFTFGTPSGISATQAETYFAFGDTDAGTLQGSPVIPNVVGGITWTSIQTAQTLAAALLKGFTAGTVQDVWNALGTSNLQWGAVLASFVNALPTDVQAFTTNFFCYVENKGIGTFNLVSALPIDGNTAPLPLNTNQGLLLVFDATSNAWYTVRGISGSTDIDFYQTVQQAGSSKPQESKLNFLSPITATDNAGNGSTDIAVPVFVGSGASHAIGLVPDPGSSAGTSRFLREDANFAIPPTMVGDSGSGGTAGYAPAPGAGDNAAGKFLSAGGTYVNPGSNPASFNTGLVYAIAAGYALG